MLIKEYRIPLPMTVEEYRIAQLYMIAKKSREESEGTESGVEILVNEPYTGGPGGNGQFTHKIYHVGSHLPGWFKSLLPKSALTVEEEAWNAYPYTRTRFKCPFVEKFSLEIETYYTPDGGHLENVFNLDNSEKRNRTVDLIDVVKDLEGTYEDSEKEDPTVYVSRRTGRGPLTENWISEHWRDCEGKTQPTPNGNSIMCAYKLCKVEFRYWGMQSKIERFIHDVALRRTMLKAHSQAWIWQDEWFGLTMEDIRAIERETAELLKKKMHGDEECGCSDDFEPGIKVDQSSVKMNAEAAAAATVSIAVAASDDDDDAPPSGEAAPSNKQHSNMRETFNSIEYSEAEVPNIISRSGQLGNAKRSRSRCSVRMTSLEGEDDVDGDEDDEFFDCTENLDDEPASSLAKWSSMELGVAAMEREDDTPVLDVEVKEAPSSGLRIAVEERIQVKMVNSLYDKASSPDNLAARSAAPAQSQGSHHHCCPTTVLVLVVHGGSVLDPNLNPSVRRSDVTTFRGAFESIMRTHYPGLVGHIVIKCVPCPGSCTEALAVLSSLSPNSFELNSTAGVSNLPIGAIPLFAASSPEHTNHVDQVIRSANEVYNAFVNNSEDGLGFCGQVCLVGDSVGSVLAYDALCRTTVRRWPSECSVADTEKHDHHHLLRPASRGVDIDSTTDQSQSVVTLDFEVTDFFVFGSPLSNVLAYRVIMQNHQLNHRQHPIDQQQVVPRPAVQQLYNLFHPSDPIACRIEPLLFAKFSQVSPINLPRYQTYPMGDGACLSLIEFIQSSEVLFNNDGNACQAGGAVARNQGGSHSPSVGRRRYSEDSVQFGVFDAQRLDSIIHTLKPGWWGSRRIDYALYCPDGLTNFPTNCLPHLFHSSYWESADVISFILRQLTGGGSAASAACEAVSGKGQGGIANGGVGGIGQYLTDLKPFQPREKWLKKRTLVKIRNGAANHRGNDVIVTEGSPQVLCGRFSYGPLDVVALSGEKVDVHIMKDPPAGEWVHVSTEITDKQGKLTLTLPPDHSMHDFGVYPVQMVVRGDHTRLYMHLAVVPPKTETVVFSIDGSFTASVSVTGKDPKVKAGAVDVVRHWQELGYLIVYVTGRPDMQLVRVVSWLSQHNFPRGLVSFADGFTTDPLKHKAEHLKSLVAEQRLVIHKAYGSSKDIGVYSSLGLTPENIYVVGGGKPHGSGSSKRHAAATFLVTGYAEHLARLSGLGGSRPALGNARMVIPKATFGLPGQLRRRTVGRQAAKRSTSYQVAGGGGCNNNNNGRNARASSVGGGGGGNLEGRWLSSFRFPSLSRRTSWVEREPPPPPPAPPLSVHKI